MPTLRALPDDWTLNAAPDTKQQTTHVVYLYNMTDPSGNKLTDPQGNYLVVYLPQDVGAKVLHALPDDFILRTE